MAYGPLVLAPVEGIGALWAPCHFVLFCIFTHGPRRWNHGSTDGLFLLLLLLLLLHTTKFLFLLGTENTNFQTGLTFQATPVTPISSCSFSFYFLECFCTVLYCTICTVLYVLYCTVLYVLYCMYCTAPPPPPPSLLFRSSERHVARVKSNF